LTDGVSMLLSEERLLQITGDASPDEAAEQLLAEANSRGGPDNLTALVVRVGSVAVKEKKYFVPEDEEFTSHSFTIGETAGGVREVEETFPAQTILSRLKRQAWYPYRFWFLATLYLLLLILLFSFWA